MESVITVKNLSKNFGGTQAVKNLSFDVYRGEIFGIIGPNGAGKRPSSKFWKESLIQAMGRLKFLDLFPISSFGS